MLQAKQASFWKWMGCTGADFQADQVLAFSTLPGFTSVGVLGHCGRSEEEPRITLALPSCNASPWSAQPKPHCCGFSALVPEFTYVL